MSLFSALDALTFEASLAVFGDLATLYPMKPGTAGPNAAPVAAADPARPVQAGILVVRSEWAERVEIGGQGMPMPPGGFRAPAAGNRHVVSLKADSLSWLPAKGDELEYADRPGIRYRITELQPDGLAGLHGVLARL